MIVPKIMFALLKIALRFEEMNLSILIACNYTRNYTNKKTNTSASRDLTEYQQCADSDQWAAIISEISEVHY